MAQLSSDGNNIEGRCFPDPTPPASTLRFSVARDSITGIQEADYDDATGQNRVVRCCLIFIGAATVVAYEDYDQLTALWQPPTPAA